MPRSTSRRSRALRAAAVAAFWLVVWQAVALAVGNPLVLTSPLAVARRLGFMAGEGGAWAAAGYSLARVAVGFALALALGTGLAVVGSWQGWLGALIGPPIRAIRSVPVVSFIILVIIWAGSGSLTVVISALMVLPIVYAGVEEGLARRDAALAEALRVFAVPRARAWWALAVPAVLPFLLAACRVGAGLAWKAGVSAEVIGLPDGSIGERLYQAKLFLASDSLLAWTAVVIALAWALERLTLWALARAEAAAERRWSR